MVDARLRRRTAVGSRRNASLVVAAVCLAASSCAGKSEAGELVGFVQLGGDVTVAGARAAWLGTDDAAAMADAPENASYLQPERLADALAAVEHRPAAGHSGAAFILSGCAHTGADLRIDRDLIDADLTEDGGAETNCDVPVGFLAVFVIAEDTIPDDARLDD